MLLWPFTSARVLSNFDWNKAFNVVKLVDVTDNRGPV
jgi:hypothetical protein